MTNTFNEIRIIIKLMFTDHASPSIAFFEKRMVVIKSGMMIGKLSTAMSVELLPAFDAIALTIESTEENPALPKTMARKYIG